MLGITLCFAVLWVLTECIMLCIYQNNILQKSFTALKNPSAVYIPNHPILPPPDPLAATDLFNVSIVLTFPECYIVGSYCM